MSYKNNQLLILLFLLSFVIIFASAEQQQIFLWNRPLSSTFSIVSLEPSSIQALYKIITIHWNITQTLTKYLNIKAEAQLSPDLDMFDIANNVSISDYKYTRNTSTTISLGKKLVTAKYQRC
ncbi:4699_t:CDS:2 [Ambispora gerdemannii]|uniref:4699_t:CDS:1 n=1 Tax=Ambispora gerdemannii TaxID=144530 RepID=A0A9N8V5H9_9GLOM|nr:4699_t:CDS:2 [Ambispora gerdemannii]